MEARTQHGRTTRREPIRLDVQPVVIHETTSPAADPLACPICGFAHDTVERGQKRSAECRRLAAVADAEAVKEEKARRKQKAKRRSRLEAYYARLDEEERQADRREDALDFGQIDRPRSYSDRLAEGFRFLGH